MKGERFDAAVSAAAGNLLEVQENVLRTLGKEEADIFEAQILLMRDVQLRNAVCGLCLEKRMNVEAVLAGSLGISTPQQSTSSRAKR